MSESSASLLATFALLPVGTKIEWTTTNFLYVKTPWSAGLTGSLSNPRSSSFSRARALDDGRIAVLCSKMGSALVDLSVRKREELLKMNIDSMTVSVPLGSEGPFWAHDDSCFTTLNSVLTQGDDAAEAQLQTEADACISN